MLRRICIIFAATALCTVSYAQQQLKPKDGKLTLSQAEKLVPRKAMMPVESCDKGETREAIDTIDTTNPAMKIVIFEDRTWEYWKDGSVAANNPCYSEYWNNFSGNPYQKDFASLPLKTVIWLVDSVGHYHYPCAAPTQISSRFGRRHGRYHRGIDLRSPTGSDVYATFDGKVRVSKWVRGYGNLVVVRHENGLETFYAHLSKRLVEAEDWVTAGDVIALSGNTGRSSGPHLHYEVRYQGFAIDPEWMVDFEKQTLRHGVLVLRKKYMSPDSKYVPESDDEEEEIAAADEADRLEAERIAAELKAAKYHTIRSGDTLGALARKYGTSVSAICKLNGITPKTTLRIGRKIRVK